MSRWLRYLLATLLVVILVADLGYKAWRERPYVVTGSSVEQSGQDLYVAVRYTLPASGTGEWRRQAKGAGATRCWGTARVGQLLPACMWSNSAINE